jgi:16S rRNA (uracil1498-N3)-methyltransferase
MRVYTPFPLKSNQPLFLEGNPARHIQVARMQPGQALRLFDGHGGEFEARISAMGRNSVTVDVGAHLTIEVENSVVTHLFVGVPANERMDWLVEKATELGVNEITPVLTQRTVVKLSGERADKRVRHWQAVAVAACEQCGRNRVPRIHSVSSFKQALERMTSTSSSGDDRLLCHLSLRPHALSLREFLPKLSHTNTNEVIVFSGPEGGFNPEEENVLDETGWIGLSLGKRTLRAETAPIMALSAFTTLAALGNDSQ